LVDATILNSTLFDNKGSSGGAVAAYSNAKLAIVNSTLSANRAGNEGGGVFISAGTVARIDNSTIVFNQAGTGPFQLGNGGGIGVIQGGNAVSSLELRSSIVAGNTHNNGKANDLFRNGPCVVNVTNSLVQADPTALLNGTNTGNLFGVDPLLAPLANNGGPTQTHLPAGCRCRCESHRFGDRSTRLRTLGRNWRGHRCRGK
jgi:hypothetical protein